MIFPEVSKAIKWKMQRFLKKLVPEELDIHMNKNEPQTLLHTVNKSKPKMSHGSNYKG